MVSSQIYFPHNYPLIIMPPPKLYYIYTYWAWVDFNMKKISDAQLEKLKLDYTQKGYLVIKNFFSKAEMVQLRLWASEVINWPETTGKWLKYFESIESKTSPHQEVVLSRIENFIRHHEDLSHFVDNKQLVALLSILLGEPVLFFKEKLNVKAPGAKGYTAHQDAPAFFDIDYDAITVLAPIDAMTVENGCLYFVENGNNFSKKLLEQNKHNRALSQSLINIFCWTPIECSPGDVIIFSSYAPHYSTENKSHDERKVLFLTYGRRSKSEGKTQQYFDLKRKLFPQDCEKLPGVDYTSAAAIYSFSSPVNINHVPNPKKPK